MKIALFESDRLMREITKNAINIDSADWLEFDHFSKVAIEAISTQRFDAIITSKQFGNASLSDIIKTCQNSYQNKETPLFLFTSDNSKMCLDEAFDMGVTDIFYKQELPALADTLCKISAFDTCIQGAHVLLVEDNETISQIFTQVLTKLNCKVHTSASCESAIAMLDKYPIELVVTDLNLEDGGQGQRIIREMRHYEKVILNKIPIMVMSACDSSQSQTGLFFLGIDDYLVKPVQTMQFSLRAVNLIKKFRIFQQSEAQAVELKEIAHFDKLTKVYNRHGFEDIASFCVANCQRQIESAIGIMYIDLDNFKQVNDTLGHAAGDEVLIKITDILKIQLREQDVIARWGGDEFVVLLNQCDVRFIEAVCGRIEQKIIDSTNLLHGVTCSIGVISGAPKSYDDIVSFIAQADKNMYVNKQSRKCALK